MADQPPLAAAALAPAAADAPPLASDLLTPLPPHGNSTQLAMDDNPAQEQEKRSSFYVQAADEMCDAVLEHEAFLFSEVELTVLRRWRAMDYQSRYLFMRLFLRKHGQWHHLSSLRNSYTSPRPSPSLKRSASSSSSLARAPSTQPAAIPASDADADADADRLLVESPSLELEEGKRFWPSDITDLNAACEELWTRIELPSPPPPVEAVKPDLEAEERDIKPVAGPSSPPPRLGTPPQKPLTPRNDAGVLDLTLTDSDDDGGVLDLTVSPVRPPRPPPKSAKARGKQPELPPPPPPPPKSPPRVDEDDLSRVAWSAEDLARDEEAEAVLGLLSMDELVGLGKRMNMKVASGRSTRGDWTKALLKTTNQSTLSFFAAPAAQAKPSVGMKRSPSGSLSVGYDARGKKLTQSSVVAKQALATIGPRRYPSYTVSRSFSIFPSREVLVRFERAVETERQLEECLDGGWAAGVTLGKRKQGEKEGKDEKLKRYRRGADIWENGVEAEWRELCDEAEREMKCQEDAKEKRLLYYQRRFHPGWPLSRAAYKAAGCYAKLVRFPFPLYPISAPLMLPLFQGQHTREASNLSHLLDQTSFRRGKRGNWYVRLALILMKYPGTRSSALPASSPTKRKAKKAKKEESDAEMENEDKKEREKRERLEEALELCQRGLNDPFTHLIYKSCLHRRIARL
ncbi:hypothetical protein JCM6882_008325 [Rhodosporidiobolus microsporus]